MTDIPQIVPQDGTCSMTVTDLVFHRHELAYGATFFEDALKNMPATTQESMAAWIATLKSTKQALVKFRNGATASIITGTPAGPAVFAKGDERVPSYEISFSVPGGEATIRSYQTIDQVNEILGELATASNKSDRNFLAELEKRGKSPWEMIADENDENVPELVKAVYRKGDNRNQHLILLDEHGAGFFGLNLKPKPSEPDYWEPDAHVAVKVREYQIQITFWDGDQSHTITLTEEAPAVWEKVLDEARNSPARLVIDELYQGELNGSSKFDR